MYTCYAETANGFPPIKILPLNIYVLFLIVIKQYYFICTHLRSHRSQDISIELSKQLIIPVKNNDLCKEIN